jgi:mannobiose 2-epimerase
MLSDQSYEDYSKIILPFWKKLIDEKNGGFYGYMDFDLNINKDAEKGVILNSRILWFFSNAYLVYGGDDNLYYAGHAYEFLKNSCIDHDYGGVYWMMNADGTPKDTIKQIYNQAFAVYALSSYYDASRNPEALETAFEIYQLIEEVAKDKTGYIDAFSRDFKPIINNELSENGVIADRTMNTLLHLLEAYTELYRVSSDEEVGKRLRWILDAFRTKLYNPKKKRLEVFFDLNMNSLIDLESYGHDIEASWLLDRACEVLGDSSLLKQTRDYTKDLAEAVYERAYKKHSIENECEKGKTDTTRVWWVQAESVVGFLNAYKYTSDGKYLSAAENILQYILTNFVDKRAGSEWFWDLNENGLPESKKPLVEPWKCPYHNGRMCFEIKKRGF